MSLMPIFRKKNSGEIARNRLKLLLVSDKTNCSPEIMEMIKDDMVQVLSKYMEIDSDGIEIQIIQAETSANKEPVPSLSANIPIRDIPNKGIL